MYCKEREHDERAPGDVGLAIIRYGGLAILAILIAQSREGFGFVPTNLRSAQCFVDLWNIPFEATSVGEAETERGARAAEQTSCAASH